VIDHSIAALFANFYTFTI